MKTSTSSTEWKTATLADEIRESEPAIIEAAVKLFRQQVALEYPRLRGYAIESGENRITLNADMVFDFNKGARTVALRTTLKFIPQVLTAHVRLG